MRIISSVIPGASRLARLQAEPSKKTRQRLKWFDYYHSRGHNARLTCRHFDISPQTFYRWKRRYDPHRLGSLEDRSHRPRHVRQPTYSVELVEAVLRLREEYPRWGKDKLVVLLENEGFTCSASTVGRILHRLKERGVLKEPILNYISVRRRQRQRPYAVRKPKEYVARVPGDIVEVDTLDVRPLPGVILKHFTAHDVISRWDVVSVHSRATASTAAHFLDTLERRMPFPVRAIQVDGGSEFEAIFEEECQRRGIKLFVLPPRSLKLNGGVERAHRTHSEEFYEVTESSFDLSELKDELLQWERVYNTVRPHQALGYLTPLKFLEQRKDYKREEVMCHQSYERVHGIASYLSRCYNWTSHWQIFGKEDNPMPTYIMLMKLTEQGVKDIKNAPQRVEQAAKTAEAIGGKMIGFYATMGEYDYVVIGECPSDEVMMTFLMGLGSLGSVRTTTLKAFTREEFAQLVKRLP